MSSKNSDIIIPVGRSGQWLTKCIECSPTRKKKNAKTLSINCDTGLYNCHHCEDSGKLNSHKEIQVSEQPKTYELPKPSGLKVSDKMVKYFESRKISSATIQRFQITESTHFFPDASEKMNAINFNYREEENGPVVLIKYRSGLKNFAMSKNSKLTLYGLWRVTPETKKIYIVEGEFDVLAAYEADPSEVVLSVPNGASAKTNNLKYIDNSYEFIKHVEHFVIATDGDDPGIKLRNELAGRFGKHRCSYLEFPNGIKDINDLLKEKGKDTVKELMDNPTKWPIEAVIEMDDLIDAVIDYHENGPAEEYQLKTLETTHKHLNLEKEFLVIISGKPGAGKSEFVDYMAYDLAKYSDWKFALWSAENQPPRRYASKLLEKWHGKRRMLNKERVMTNDEIKSGLIEMKKNFTMIAVDEMDLDIDSLINKAKELVFQKGISAFVIDNWAYVEHKYLPGENETKYVERVLTKLRFFCKTHNCSIWLIAHPKQLQRKRDGTYPVPTLYDISGSAHFYNKCDIGIVVDREQNYTADIHIQKIRFQHDNNTLPEGPITLAWDRASTHYKDKQGPPEFKGKPPINPSEPLSGQRLIEIAYGEEDDDTDDLPF